MTVLVPTRKNNTRLFNNLRRLANLLVLVGYYVLLNVSMTTGITIRIFSAILVIPWMISNKVWDGVFVMSIMTSIDVHKLIVILLGF